MWPHRHRVTTWDRSTLLQQGSGPRTPAVPARAGSTLITTLEARCRCPGRIGGATAVVAAGEKGPNVHLIHDGIVVGDQDLSDAKCSGPGADGFDAVS